MEELVWTTQDGRKLTPSQFEDGHLINTIRFIEVRAEDMKLDAELGCIQAASMFQGDMAQFSMEQEERRIANMSPGEYLGYAVPIYRALCNEARKRGLTWESALPDGEVFIDEDADEESDEGEPTEM